MARENLSSRSTRCRAALAWLAAAALLVVAACTDSRQRPAEQAIAEIDAVVTAAGTAPVKYIPGELKRVQRRLDDLRRDYAKHHYAEVVEQAPDVLRAARALAPTAAARETELLQGLRTEWDALAQAVPAELAAVADRFEQAAARRNKRAQRLSPEDVRAGRSRLRDALALWDRARQEQSAGRLPEAVTLAHEVRDMGRSVDALADAGAAGAAVK